MPFITMGIEGGAKAADEIRDNIAKDITALINNAVLDATKGHQVAKAEQQLLGFFHSMQGYDLKALIGSMGLNATEWEEMLREYDLAYLKEKDREEITTYVNQN